MQTRRSFRQGHALWHQRQVLPERPPDRREPLGRSVMHPAGQRHQHQGAVKQPMHDLGQQRFGPAIRMERRGFWLAYRPENTGEGDEKQRHPHRLVQREQPRLVGQLLCRVIGHVIGDDPQRDHRGDTQRGQPVKRFGDSTVLSGGIRDRHMGHSGRKRCGESYAKMIAAQSSPMHRRSAAALRRWSTGCNGMSNKTGGVP